MFQRVAQSFLIFALVALLGGHWVLLRTIAWTTMLAGNLQSAGITTAMERTFDGDHPCCLCKAIDSAKRTEHKADTTTSLQRLEFLEMRQSFVFAAPVDYRLLPTLESFVKTAPRSPPTPPPRFASLG